nr:DUF4396 domain-containing protein [Sporichthya sp.]
MTTHVEHTEATISITVMEIVDNAVVLVVPGAMDAGLASLLFWSSLALALAVASLRAGDVAPVLRPALTSARRGSARPRWRRGRRPSGLRCG